MRRKCLDCRGTGTDDDRIDRECHSCRGYGYIVEDDDGGREKIQEGDYHLYAPRSDTDGDQTRRMEGV